MYYGVSISLFCLSSNVLVHIKENYLKGFYLN